MKRTSNITCWTDYPILALGDASGKPAPIRQVRVLSYDQNKYAKVIVLNPELKSGNKVVFHPKVWTNYYTPYYDEYGDHEYEVVNVWEGDHIELKGPVKVNGHPHDDELVVYESIKWGYLYTRPGRLGQVPTINRRKLEMMIPHNLAWEYDLKQQRMKRRYG